MSAEFIIGAAIFAIGVVAGVFFVVSFHIQREERDFRRTGRISMTRPARDPGSQGTRDFVRLSSSHCADLSSAAVPYQDTLI
jgi:hypothetical protein